MCRREWGGKEWSGVEWRGRGDADEDHAYSAAFLHLHLYRLAQENPCVSDSSTLDCTLPKGSFKPILAPSQCTITSPEGRL